MVDTARAYERGLVRGVLNYSHLHGPWTLLRRTPLASGGKSRVSPDDLANWDADGVIWRESDVSPDIGKLDIPCVYAPNTKVSSCYPNILTDDAAIGRMAVEHLLGLGYRHLAFYGLEQKYHWSNGRRLGFTGAAQGVADCTCAVYDLDSKRMRMDRAARQRKLRDWLASQPTPFGLMVCTDDCCVDCFEACHNAGLRVPEDVAVVGVGNDELICDFVDPPLSSIYWNTEQTGYDAAELLAGMMDGTIPREGYDVCAEPLHVVRRQSTDIAAPGDPHFAAALRFIRDHATKNIHVEDVLRHVPVSRRVLYRRFKARLGRSIYAEIRRVRVDRASTFLIESNLPIHEIALKLGCEDSKNFSRLFRQEKKMSPAQYRKKYAVYR
ncbi:Xylose operon regulatory protein [Kiritimatiella glycovorans]|uniref:Xylose operon regulatory protein n=1 Tax=Kiritimatiella glycovorans TaxID=1307763 RepID=A0A0G3EI81_9BACT|nr:Xylose operon regulatory protein [Kiritimatiella glycovorans]